jgi:hypothetical protein
LAERTRLPIGIAELYLDRQRPPVSILGRLRVARCLIGPAGLIPGHADAAGLVQPSEARAGLGAGRERLRVTALVQPHRAELALADRDIALVAESLGERDGLLIGRRRLIRTAGSNRPRR